VLKLHTLHNVISRPVITASHYTKMKTSFVLAQIHDTPNRNCTQLEQYNSKRGHKAPQQ